MLKNEKKMRNVIDIINNLDITLEMFNYATSKYKKVAEHLTLNNIDAIFYPQGSFALGTTVRPYKDDKNIGYDLDAVCQVVDSKQDTAPSVLKKKIESILRYKELEKTGFFIYDECCTLEFKKIHGCEFSVDVISAVDEDITEKLQLKQKARYPNLINDAIAIPMKTPHSYRWRTNNPIGYKSWFDGINQKFLEVNPIITRESIAEQYMNKFSIEEIDPNLERTALQIVIKILKRHRDVYFSKKANNEVKPISAILTTLAASIASYADPSFNVSDLLEYILNDLTIYSKRQSLNEAQFSLTYADKNIISRTEGTWRIENPANPDDNLANEWNNNKQLAEAFFEWIGIIIIDFISLEKHNDNNFVSTLSNAFGSDIVKRSINIEDYAPKYQQPNVFTPSQKTKPYKN